LIADRRLFGLRMRGEARLFPLRRQVRAGPRSGVAITRAGGEPRRADGDVPVHTSAQSWRPYSKSLIQKQVAGLHVLKPQEPIVVAGHLFLTANGERDAFVSF
jgi:hypothetical protein